VGDKGKFMRPKAPRVGDKCGRQVGDKWETGINSCDPRHPEWETKKGNKGERIVTSCGPRHPGGDKCKLMRPKEPRVGNKCGRQVWETSVNSCGPRRPE